jgi:hypothetical protein
MKGPIRRPQYQWPPQIPATALTIDLHHYAGAVMRNS